MDTKRLQRFPDFCVACKDCKRHHLVFTLMLYFIFKIPHFSLLFPLFYFYFSSSFFLSSLSFSPNLVLFTSFNPSSLSPIFTFTFSFFACHPSHFLLSQWRGRKLPPLNPNFVTPTYTGIAAGSYRPNPLKFHLDIVSSLNTYLLALKP